MEYFVIAEREIILGFKLVGVDGSIAVNRNEALDAFRRVTGLGGAESVPVDERPKILILTEDVSAMIEEEVLKWQKSSQYPLIVEIPGIHGHMEGKKSLTDAIREAVGISV
ncbi:V-type ATP synthase subunit F [Treponema sp.]|uniref:V-type ATP synthase subunit F n=1 Tax=Treponema sp. TaxID=166 RepID=UPI00388F91A7